MVTAPFTTMWCDPPCWLVYVFFLITKQYRNQVCLVAVPVIHVTSLPLALINTLTHSLFCYFR